MKFSLALVCLLLLLFSGESQAACAVTTVEDRGADATYVGSCTEDDEDLILTTDSRDHDACLLMSITGSVDVRTSADGTNYSSAALSLNDYGATDGTKALATTAGRWYGFVSKFRSIRVEQVGSTDAEAVMVCFSY